MNKLVILSLACLLGFVSLSSANPKVEAVRELAKCAIQNCASQVNGARTLFKTELDGCLATCNASGKKLSLLADEELKDLKGCFQANNCKLPLQHLKEHAHTPQVQALKACAGQNCKEQVIKAKSLGIGH